MRRCLYVVIGGVTREEWLPTTDWALSNSPSINAGYSPTDRCHASVVGLSLSWPSAWRPNQSIIILIYLWEIFLNGPNYHNAPLKSCLSWFSFFTSYSAKYQNLSLSVLSSKISENCRCIIIMPKYLTYNPLRLLSLMFNNGSKL